MSFNITKIITDAADLLWDTYNRRFPQSSLLVWANYTLDDLSDILRFRKKSKTISGNQYIHSMGETPRYYDLSLIHI